jgi:riboflavin kinase/FMN adenylyltransferase
MKRIAAGERLPLRPVVTIGTFDGVHRGHRTLFDRARALADSLGTTWVVLTFDRPPFALLSSQQGRVEITPLEEKLALLDEAGVPAVGVLVFDRRLARLPPEAFLTDVVSGWLNAAAVVEGSNFTFGAGARGNTVTLRAWAEPRGITVDILPRRRGIHEWSSTRVRDAIRAGHLAVAEEILGRPAAAVGPVVPGDGRGASIGVPTANVALSPYKLMPPAGVYAGWLAWDDQPARLAVANWGTRPTFDGDAERLEVHVPDWTGNLVGRIVRFTFGRYLRGVQRFDGPEALVRQIQSDIAEARRLAGPASAWIQGVAEPPTVLTIGGTADSGARLAELLREYLIEPWAPTEWAGRPIPAGARAFLGTPRAGIRAEWWAPPQARPGDLGELGEYGDPVRTVVVDFDGLRVPVSRLEYAWVAAVRDRREAEHRRLAERTRPETVERELVAELARRIGWTGDRAAGLELR